MFILPGNLFYIKKVPGFLGNDKAIHICRFIHFLLLNVSSNCVRIFLSTQPVHKVTQKTTQERIPCSANVADSFLFFFAARPVMRVTQVGGYGGNDNCASFFPHLEFVRACEDLISNFVSDDATLWEERLARTAAICPRVRADEDTRAAEEIRAADL